MEREQAHNPKDDHGVEKTPCKQVAPDAGWLVREANPQDNKYTGDNAPWRR
jgi:hypothetical protein